MNIFHCLPVFIYENAYMVAGQEGVDVVGCIYVYGVEGGAGT